MGTWMLPLVLSGMLGVVSSAAGQTPAEERPAQAPVNAPAGAGPLSGPTVEKEAEGGGAESGSLVRRDFSGKLERLEVRPEQAALDLLGLTAEERRKVDGVLLERAEAMDQLVRENLELLVRMQSAREGGDARERRKVLQELRSAAERALGTQRLEEQIVRELPERTRGRFRGLVSEYLSAVGEEEAKGGEGMEGAGERGRRGGEMFAGMRAQLVVFGQEIKSAYERYAAEGSAQLERFIRGAGLSAEQEGRVRGVIMQWFQETKGNATQAQKAELWARVAPELTVEQRLRVLEMMSGAR
ncbi:MAG: hypothetical protein SFZ24_06000 [Planctomycetota bacterium]|nr:hypothetical protein [Planctomycetota bacterium]